MLLPAVGRRPSAIGQKAGCCPYNLPPTDLRCYGFLIQAICREEMLVSLIDGLAKSKLFKMAAYGLLLVTALLAFAGETYCRFYYAEVMPRSPQPETGRTYQIPARGGGHVYVNQ